MDKLIQLKDRFDNVWAVPLDKIQWFDRTADRDRQDVLAIANKDTEYMRQRRIPEDDYLLLHTTDGTYSDICSGFCGNVLGRVNIADLIQPF